MENQRVLLADEVGCGKSTQTLHAIEQLGAYPALIICPASLRLNWAKECHQWLPHRSYRLLDTKNKLGDSTNPSDIYIVSYDIAHKFVDAASRHMRSLICDESQYLGNLKSRRTRAVTRIAEFLDIKFLLSGTPVMNRPIELVGQLQILDVLQFFGGYWDFAKRYAGLRHNGFGFEARGATHLQELHDKLVAHKCFLRRTKSEVMEQFPDVRVLRTDVEPNTNDLYTLEKQVIWELDCLSSAKQFGSLMNLVHAIGVAKINSGIEWVSNFLLTSNKKLVVFAHHREVQHAFVSNLPNTLAITSDMDMPARHKNIQRFRDEPDKRVMVCSLKAAGVGIDGLQHVCDTVLFVEQGWNPPTMEQAIGRVHRFGQKNAVDAYVLVIPNTFDEDMWDLVQLKKTHIDKITGDMLNKLKGRYV